MKLYNFGIALLEFNGEKHLLYGCISDSKSGVEYVEKPKTYEINEDIRLLIQTKRFNSDESNKLKKTLKDNQINGESFLDIDRMIVDKKTFFQFDSSTCDNMSRYFKNLPESINGRTNSVDVYYSEDQSSLIELIDNFTNNEKLDFNNKVLSTLNDHFGLTFDSAYRYRLGCFEIHNSLTTNFPRVRKTDEGFSINTNQKDEQQYNLHIVLRDGEEVIYDKLIIFSNDEIYENVKENYNSSEITVFDKSGELIHKEHHIYIEHISSTMGAVLGRPFYIDDKLTKKLKDKKQASKARVVSPNIIKTPMYTSFDKSIYKKNKLNITELFFKEDRRLKGGFYAKYKEDNEKGEAFSWLIDLINNYSYVVIIDPYFCSKTVTESLRRINQDVSVHVITSLDKVDEENPKDNIEDFKKVLEQCAGEINCTLKIENLTKEDGGKLFHDRFIITRRGTDENVYLLSNSLSAYCESFPFTYMPVDKNTATKVLAYFENRMDDCKREILWDSKIFAKKINKVEQERESRLRFIMSKYFTIGIKLLNGEIKKYDEFTSSKESLENIIKNSKGLIAQSDLDFKTDIDVFDKSLYENLINSLNDISYMEVACVLATCGELMARCHCQDLFDKIITWLNDIKAKVDLNKTYEQILIMHNVRGQVDKKSEDISYPIIEKWLDYFKFAEDSFKRGFPSRRRAWGIFFSTQLLIKVIPLKVQDGKFSGNIIQESFSGMVYDLIPNRGKINKDVCKNLLASEQKIFQIFGLVYLNISEIDLVEIVKILNVSKVDNEMIVFSMLRKYKQLMHKFYRCRNESSQKQKITCELNEIAKYACSIWDQLNVKDDLVKDFYSCFFGKYEFVYWFGGCLKNEREMKKLYTLVIEEIEKEYGWNSKDDEHKFISSNNQSKLVWGARIYVDLNYDNFTKGIYKWDSKFIRETKKILNKPLYSGDSSNLADRYVNLLFFVSEILKLLFDKSFKDVSKRDDIIQSLFDDSKELFQCEKYDIFSINRDVYFGLLQNLVLLFILSSKRVTIKDIGTNFPFSNFMSIVLNDADYEESTIRLLDQISSKIQNPIFEIINWIYCVCYRAFVEKKYISKDILAQYYLAIEGLNMINDDLFKFPDNIMRQLKGEIKGFSITCNNRILIIGDDEL